MNSYQAVWYEQVKSDHDTLRSLIQVGADQCHVLHYLQMVTEKLGKAYYWRNGSPPPKSHQSFVRFLQLLDSSRSKSDLERISRLFGFPNGRSFASWIKRNAPLAHQIEKLAPALAGEDAPNTEYPWPSDAPTQSPATFRFPNFEPPIDRGPRRQFLMVLKAAVEYFPEYA